MKCDNCNEIIPSPQRDFNAAVYVTTEEGFQQIANACSQDCAATIYGRKGVKHIGAVFAPLRILGDQNTRGWFPQTFEARDIKRGPA